MKLAAEPSCGPETFDDKALRLAAFGLVGRKERASCGTLESVSSGCKEKLGLENFDSVR